MDDHPILRVFKEEGRTWLFVAAIVFLWAGMKWLT